MKTIVKKNITFGLICLSILVLIGSFLWLWFSAPDTTGVYKQNDDYGEYEHELERFVDEVAFDRDPETSALERAMNKEPTIEGLDELLQDKSLSNTKRLRYFDRYCDLLARQGRAERLRELLEEERAKGEAASRAVVRLKRWIELAEGKERSRDMIGKPLRLEGICLDGTELDWESYRGKIVIVDVWATWNEDDYAVADFHSIQENYEKYRDKGLEVVGYNLDSNAEDIKKMKEGNPWKIVSETLSLQERDENGEPRFVSFFNYYALNSIPTAILVDRDGNAIATNVAKDELTERLKEIFGEN